MMDTQGVKIEVKGVEELRRRVRRVVGEIARFRAALESIEAGNRRHLRGLAGSAGNVLNNGERLNHWRDIRWA